MAVQAPIPIHNNPESPQAAAPSSANATTAGNIASSSAGYTTKTRISSLADLKKKAPKVYKAMIMSICQNIITSNQRSNDRLIKAMKQNNKQS